MTEDAWWFERTWNSHRRGSALVRCGWDGGGADILLYDDGVPQTSRRFLQALPLEVELVQVAWSGEMVMSTSSYSFGPDVNENEVRLVRPGDLTWDAKVGELCLVYGDAECRLPSGENTVTVFGSVVPGDDAEGLLSYCRARRFDGRGTVRFTAHHNAEARTS